MRRLLCVFAISMVLIAAAENHVLFLHHGDDVDAFLYSEIDSIRYSSINLDSIDVNQPVVQEIWTNDSVYRYLIADIDSVTFQTPPTIAKEGSIDLNKELLPYILCADYSDGVVLKLLLSTPSAIIPKPEQCLYLEKDTQVLPFGFAGRVLDISYGPECIDVKCESVNLDEIFSQIIWVGSYNYEPVEETKSILRKNIDEDSEYDNNFIWLSLNPEYPDYIQGVIQMTDELKDIPAGPEYAQIKGKIAIQPYVHCIATAFILPLKNGKKLNSRNFYTYVKSKVEAKVDGRYIVEGKQTVGKRNMINFVLPLGLGQVCNLKYGCSMTLDGPMGLDYTYKAEYTTSIVSAVKYDNQGFAYLSSTATHKPTKDFSYALDASMDGSVSLTGTLSLTHVQSGDSLKSITNGIMYGTALNGNALYKTSQIPAAATDNSLYKRITETGVVASPVQAVFVNSKYADATLNNKYKLDQPNPITFYAVPKFSNPNFDESSSVMSYKVEGEPMNFSSSHLGVAVEHGKNLFDWVSTNKVWPDACRQEFSTKIDYDPSTDHVVYPTVTLPTGERILASPEYSTNNDNPVIDNGVIFVPISGSEINEGGVRFWFGVPIIGEVSDGTTVLVEGKYYPIN